MGDVTSIYLTSLAFVVERLKIFFTGIVLHFVHIMEILSILCHVEFTILVEFFFAFNTNYTITNNETNDVEFSLYLTL